jgi:large subunit ribosomal protein L18
MIHKQDRNEARRVRQRRVRKKVSGTAERPRLNVFRSIDHIYAQLIVDETGNTLLSASTIDPEIKGQLRNGGNIDAAKVVGELLAKRALAKGITQVVFDRAGYLYHGRVAALAEAARQAGLQF